MPWSRNRPRGCERGVSVGCSGPVRDLSPAHTFSLTFLARASTATLFASPWLRRGPVCMWKAILVWALPTSSQTKRFRTVEIKTDPPEQSAFRPPLCPLGHAISSFTFVPFISCNFACWSLIFLPLSWVCLSSETYKWAWNWKTRTLCETVLSERNGYLPLTPLTTFYKHVEKLYLGKKCYHGSDEDMVLVFEVQISLFLFTTFLFWLLFTPENELLYYSVLVYLTCANLLCSWCHKAFANDDLIHFEFLHHSQMKFIRPLYSFEQCQRL